MHARSPGRGKADRPCARSRSVYRDSRGLHVAAMRGGATLCRAGGRHGSTDGVDVRGGALAVGHAERAVPGASQRSPAAVQDDARLGPASSRRRLGRRDRDRAGARWDDLRDPSLLRELLRGTQRGADPQVRRQREDPRHLGTGDVHLPARRDGRSRRQPLGHRRARRERQGTPGLQVQLPRARSS